MAPPRAAILGVAGPRLGASERAFLREADPWGVILFERNVSDAPQLTALTSEIREALGREAVIFTDQEGGRVQRLGPPRWPRWEDAGAMVAGLDDAAAEEAMTLRFRLIAEDLRGVGIDADCAPVLDLALPGADPIIGARAVSDDPERVGRLGRAARRGLEAGGVRPVIKHAPGHGRADMDSHLGPPTVAADRETLEATDFAPFRANADAAMAMTAHVVFAALDPGRCATLSPEIIALIRGEIGFAGLLMSDDLSMGALSGPMRARAEAALAAGCDIVLHCNGDPAEAAAVMEAAPALSGAALSRAEAAARPLAPEAGFDAAAARARLAALTGRDALA